MEPTVNGLSFLPPFMAGLIISTGIGLLIGLEREFNTREERGHLAGLRTFPLLALTGFVTTWFAEAGQHWLLPVAIGGLFVLVSVAYYAQTREQKYGLTTETSLIITFLLGGLVAYGFTIEALAVGVVVTALLSMKEEFHRFITQITEKELLAFIKFTVLALLLLPLLPNETFGPEGILNYREVGWIVVLVSSISFAGYMALKFSGAEKGILLTALLGGLLSSTMIAWVFSARSRQTPELARQLAAGILLSSSVLFVRVVVLVWLFSPGMRVQMLLPCLVMLAVSLLIVWRVGRTDHTGSTTEKLTLGNPLDIRNALFFAVLFVGIAFLLYYSRQWLGNSGAVMTAALSGVADMDAITISSAKWAQAPDQYHMAVRLILVAMLSNTAFKLIVVLVRGHQFIRRYVLLGFGTVLVMGLLSIVLLTQ